MTDSLELWAVTLASVALLSLLSFVGQRVLAAREIQLHRGFANARMPTKVLRKLCKLDAAGERTLEAAVERMGLSARAHDRILKT